jgi:hypothetical protein
MLLKTGVEAKGFFQVDIGGVLTNGTSPNIVIYRNDLETTITPVISNPSAGLYQFSFLIPETWQDYDQIYAKCQINVKGLDLSLTKFLGTIYDLSKITEIWQILGLDTSNVVTHSTTKITSGNIEINLDIDAQNNTVTNTRV